MPLLKPDWAFLRKPYMIVLSAILLIEAVSVGALAPAEQIPANNPLRDFPLAVADWVSVQETPIDEEVQNLLKADDSLNRTYADRNRELGNLFIAFFRTQRAGAAPHSPKVCLPGSGWVPLDSEFVNISLPGHTDPIQVNRYIVSRGDEKSVVYYWYQTPHRVIASEYMAKLYTMADGLRFHRTDTALVRVIVSVNPKLGEAAAQEAALRFIRAFFDPVKQYLPA